MRKPCLVLLIAVAMTTPVPAIHAARPDPDTREGLLSLTDDNMGLDPEGTLHRVRLKVVENPNDIDFAVALVRMLGTYGRGDREEVERASRWMLQRHPGNVQLYYARAAALDVPAALDVYAEIGRHEGQADRASRTAEVRALGFSVRRDWKHGVFNAAWAQRLLYLGRIGEAAKVLDDGEKGLVGRTSPPEREAEVDPTPIHATRAIVQGYRRDFDGAMQSQRLAKFPQLNVELTCRGLADVLLLQGEPTRAVESFGDLKVFNDRVAAIADDWERRREREVVRVLAWSHFRAGNAAEAERLLKAGDDISDRLLLLRLYQEQRRDDEAKKTADAIVEPLTPVQGSRGGPRFPQSDAARSLAPHYAAALRWLCNAYGEKRDLIAIDWGMGEQVHSGVRTIPITFEPASVAIVRLREQLRETDRSPDEYKAMEHRRWLAQQLASLGRYEEAADTMAPLAIGRPPRTTSQVGTGMLMWSVYRRKADAEKLFAKEPEKALDAFRYARVFRAPVGGRPKDQLSIDEATKRLIAIGPGALSAVHDILGVNTISGEDRSNAVAIIEVIGGREDVPALLSVYELLARETERGPQPGFEANGANNRTSIAALERCLAKFTGVKPDAETPKDRVTVWRKWWDDHALEIVRPVDGKLP